VTHDTRYVRAAQIGLTAPVDQADTQRKEPEL